MNFKTSDLAVGDVQLPLFILMDVRMAAAGDLQRPIHIGPMCASSLKLRSAAGLDSETIRLGHVLPATQFFCWQNKGASGLYRHGDKFAVFKFSTAAAAAARLRCRHDTPLADQPHRAAAFNDQPPIACSIRSVFHINGDGSLGVHLDGAIHPICQEPNHAIFFGSISKAVVILAKIFRVILSDRYSQPIGHLSAVAGVCCKICSFVFPDTGVIAHHHGDSFNHRIRVGVVLGVLTAQFRIVAVLRQQASEGHAASYDLAKAAAGEGDGAALHGRQVTHIAAGDGQLSINVNAEVLPLGKDSPALHSNLPVLLNLFHLQNAA